MKILILNAGSSSQKSCLYDLQSPFPGVADSARSEEPIAPLWEGAIDWLHQPRVAELKIKGNGQEITQQIPTADRNVVTKELLSTLHTGTTQVINDLAAINVVGHRIVHGGDRYNQPVLIAPEVEEAIEQLIPLAPAHNPANLEGIKLIRQVLPQVPQVAVFDTAFHQTMPPAAVVYPLPYELYEQGIRRYGFHGISHQYCSDRAAKFLAKTSGKPLESLKLINCHLGNGCSLAAIKNGISVDTTMGFTPLEGLMMGSRSGSIDPGILLYLLRQGSSVADLDNLLYKESGLKGVSGISSDLRQILAAIDQGHQQAQLALEVFIHRLSSGIAALVPSLGGLDGLIFTGGIGEHNPLVRKLTCDRLNFLGIAIDQERNWTASGDSQPDGHKEWDISTPASPVKILVIPTQEDWAIAKACEQLLQM